MNPCTGPSLQPAFQIYNNGTTPVQITSLQIRGWFNQYAIVGSGWGGEVYRCHVYDNTGTQVDPSGIASTAVMATGTYGSHGNAGDLLVHDEPDDPGRGLCEGGHFGAFFPLNSTDPSGLFDTGCSNYSGVGGATPYNPAFYYEDSHWQLIEGGQPVCEYAGVGVKDPNTGIPAGGSTCSCPTGGVVASGHAELGRGRSRLRRRRRLGACATPRTSWTCW